MPDPNPLVDQFNAVLQNAPHLTNNPSVAVPLALNPAAAPQVPAVAALDRGQQLTAALVRMPQDQELAAWNGLSEAEKSMARAAGYRAAFERQEEEKKKGWKQALGFAVNPINWLEMTKDAAGDAIDAAMGALDAASGPAGAVWDNTLGDTMGFIGEHTPIDDAIGGVAGHAFDTFVKPLGELGGQALDAYGYVTGKIDQFYRAGKMSGADAGPLDDIPGVGMFASTFQNIGNIATGDFGRWWDEAARSNAPMDPKFEKQAREKYGDRVVDLVRRQQKNPQDLLDQRAKLIAEGKTDEAAELDEFTTSETFATALREMDNGLLSPGRDFARSVGLEGQAQDYVSGLTDGVYRIVTDPLLAGGKAIQGGRAVQYGLATGDAASASARVTQLFDNPRVERYFDDLGKHLDEIRNPSAPGAAGNALQQVERNFKAITPEIREGMVRAGVNDATSAMVYLRNAEGYAHLIKGKAAFGRPLMPYRTAVRANLEKFKPSEAIDWIAAGPRIVMDDLVKAGDDAALMAGQTSMTASGSFQLRGGAAQVAKDLERAGQGFRGRAATAHRRLTTKLPVLEQGYLNHAAPGADAQVGKIAAMFGPKYWARQVQVTYMHADEVGRRDILKGLYATGFEAMGVTKTAAGREWAGKFFKTMDEQGAYSVTGLGVNPVTGQQSALFLDDARNYSPVPNFAELIAQSAKISAAREMNHVVNAPMVDWYMNTVWRPSVLLRPALAPRNALDETLNQYIREGAGTIASGRAGMRALNKAQQDAWAAANVAAKDAVLAAKAAEDAATAVLGSLDLVPGKIVAIRAQEALAPAGSPQALALKSQADDLQNQLNGVAAAKARSSEAANRLVATPDAFDTEMGRMFRFATAGPRVLGEKLVAHSTPGSVTNRIGAIMADPTKNVYNFYKASIYGRFSEANLKAFNPSMMAAIGDLVDNDYARTMFAKNIMEASSRSSRMEIDNALALGKKGSAFQPTKVRVNGDWGKVTAAGDDGADSWALWLDKAADDPVGRHMLLHLDDEAEAIAGAVRIINANPEYMARMSIVRDVGPERFAVGMFQEVKAHTASPDGTIIRELLDNLRFTNPQTGAREINKKAFDLDNLRLIPETARPTWVLGQSGMWMETSASPMSALVKGGFKYLGDMTAYMSRQNQFVSAYAQARELMLPLQNDMIARLGGDQVAIAAAKQKMTRDAIDFAVTKVTAYVDNPAIRSQTAVLMRNLAPFWRAQEEFFMRWGKAMKYNPESFGRAFLGVHAATASGFVQKDDNGTPYFVYPGAGIVHSMMTHVGELFGMDMTRLPIASPMTGKVQMLTPGFNPDGTVHIFNGPMLAAPISMMRRLTDNPTFDEFEKATLGPGAGRGFLESQIPAFFRPLYQEYSMGDEKHEMNALAAIFSKFGVGENIPGTEVKLASGEVVPVRVPTQADITTNPEMVTAFRDLVRKHSNGIRLMRSVLGPIVPAYPKITPDTAPDASAAVAGMASIRQEYFDLVKRLQADPEIGDDAFSVAYNYWFAEHPTEIPYVVGQSDIEGSVPLSNSVAAGDFIRGNLDLLEQFPKAGLFFIPQGDDFDMKTYNLTMDLGLRETKELGEYMKDLTISDTVSTYYDQRAKFYEKKEAAKAAGNRAEVTRLNEKWSEYSKQYQALNPLVADYMANGQLRGLERERTFDDMERLLQSGRAPEGPTTDMYQSLVTGWRTYQRKRLAITGGTDYDQNRKKNLDEQFDRWSAKVTEGSAAGKLFYGKLLKNMEPS